MSFAYGYNIEKAKEVIEDLKVNHRSFGDLIRNTWDNVQSTIEREWVGVDSESYIKTLAKRVNDLYVATTDLVHASRVTVTNLVNSWIEFQEKNVLEGGVTVDARFSRLEEPQRYELELPIEVRDFIGPMPLDRDLGLQNTNSADKIKSVVSEFVTAIKRRVEVIMHDFDLSSALFGEQSSSLRGYVASVMRAVADIVTAIKDLNDALDTLANTNYSTADADVSTQLTQETSNVSSQVDQTVTTRWV